MPEATLEALRDRIRALDQELVDLAAQRLELTRQVGEVKRREGLPTVDYSQERVVLERARAFARQRGLDQTLAEDMFTLLIRAAVTVQDEDSLRVAAVGAGQTATVVGGAGRMGVWLRRFLSAQGYLTSSLDPSSGNEESQRALAALPTADLVVCSTPPLATAQLYRSWLNGPPAGVIVDISSIKTPLVEPIRSLQRAGGRVASIHPMFGPSTVLLRGADVVICDTDDAEAGMAVERLFLPTTARVVHMPLTEHDRIMADLLSLAHAAAIAVALALPENQHPVSSTTFGALKSLAGSVVRESSEVYYEIQAMNPHSSASLQRLATAVERIVQAVSARDPKLFETLLLEGQRHTMQGSVG
jgi:chorismate mutase / prephenate dehydrogenase